MRSVSPELSVGGQSGHGSSTGGREERSPEPKRPGSLGQAAADGGRAPSLEFLPARKEMLTSTKYRLTLIRDFIYDE
jgi:hypothetical protein